MDPEIANSAAPPVGTVDAFYSRALPRISRFMITLSLGMSVGALFFYGWRIAAGFVCGAAIATLNFHWLKRVVIALADEITETGQKRSGKGIVLRFLLRYVLMALGAYVILTVSPASLFGLFAGLFVPVGAIACEAAYEVYVAMARGT